MPLDDRQANELYLTSAQSLLAAILLADLEFSRKEATMIFVLFSLQLVMTSAHVWFIWLYLGIAAFLLIFGPRAKSAEFLSLTFSLPGRGRR